MSGTFVIAQGGGPTAVINQTLAGALTAIRERHPGARVLGSRHGVRGLRDNDLVELTALSESDIARLACIPSAALGSTRDKPDVGYCEAVLKGLRRAGAEAFIYIGGNDTAGTQLIVSEACGGVRSHAFTRRRRSTMIWPRTIIRRASYRRRNSSPARLPEWILIFVRCPAFM